MTQYKVTPTGVERFFSERDLIVSKTDTRGRITYANNIFRDIAGFDGKALEMRRTASSVTRTCRAVSSSCCGTR